MYMSIYQPETLTVAEFRKQMKMALDYCVQGGTIEIERMGQRFLLMSAPRKDSGVGLLTTSAPLPEKPVVETLVAKGLETSTAGKIASEATPVSNAATAAEALPSVGELSCCANEFRPCKHWVWDTNGGEGYINSLSGRVREVE